MSKTLKVVSPITEEIVRDVPVDSAEDVQKKIALAEKAFHQWRKKSFEQRGEILIKVAKHLRDNKDAHGRPMTEEMGKPVGEAHGEVEKSAWCAEHYAEHAEAYLERDVIESDAKLSYVQYLPLGPVLGILPWNAPYWLAFRFCAPALMAGNTCLMKPDPQVPGCAQEIEKAFKECGAPEGIFQALYLQTPDVEAVIRDERVRAISFTGSSQGGAKVASMAASEVKPAVLELGGSDPNIVLKGCDLEKATDALVLSRIINAGQSCIAAKRIIVEESIYDDVVKLLQKKFSELKVGDPRDTNNRVGPIARKDLRDNLHRQVEQAKKDGAKCLMGGEMPSGKGFFYPVTMLIDVDQKNCAFREETFGPVAVVIKTKDASDALKLANDSPYGLGAAIWTGDSKAAEEMSRDIFSGQVAINGVVKTDPRLPSGGIKRSGYGRELGPHGIKEFVNAQQVWIGES